MKCPKCKSENVRLDDYDVCVVSCDSCGFEREADNDYEIDFTIDVEKIPYNHREIFGDFSEDDNDENLDEVEKEQKRNYDPQENARVWFDDLMSSIDISEAIFRKEKDNTIHAVYSNNGYTRKWFKAYFDDKLNETDDNIITWDFKGVRKT